MTSTIYYFSATGNTLHIAKIIADAIGAELLPMTAHMGDTCSSGKIGILFPTYFWGAPRTVTTFIRKLNILAANPYIFTVTSYGAIQGGSIGFINQLLSEKNLSLAYGKAIRGVANFIEEYNPRVKPAKTIAEQAGQSAAEAAEQIMAGAHSDIPRVSLKDRLFYKIYTDMKLNKDSGFHADPDCTGCGICTKVCPNHNITLKDGRPHFLHNCEHCTACIHWCPQSALQWKKSTQTRNRYHHPDITLQEIIPAYHSPSSLQDCQSLIE